MGVGGDGGLEFRAQKILKGFDGNLKGVLRGNCEEEEGVI